jgi:hypothetical protein
VREGVLAVLITPFVGAGNAVIVGFAARVWSTLLELALSGGAVAMPAPGGAAALSEYDESAGSVRRDDVG